MDRDIDMTELTWIETRHDRVNMDRQRLDMTELTWTETRHDRANMDRD